MLTRTTVPALIFGLALTSAAAAYALDPPKAAPASCPMLHAGPKPEMTVAVETTKSGATLKLTAKNAADAAKVQELARALAAHLEQGCKANCEACPHCTGPGHGPGQGAMHGHGHGHGPQRN